MRVGLVLDATKLLDEHEVRFLETQLLHQRSAQHLLCHQQMESCASIGAAPGGSCSEYAALEQRIRTRLTPYCVINSQDLSAQRIFRVNSLAAKKRACGAGGCSGAERVPGSQFRGCAG